MPSLLDSHLEQISLCAKSIAELPFPGPKIFTTALLSQHDITSLIRDTESHERALFHLAPPPLPSRAGGPDFVSATVGSTVPSTASRRATMYGSRQPKNRAVAAVLGGDLYQRTRGEGATIRQKGEVDVELLLQGAEKLASVYPIAGVNERISQLRRRHQQLKANISHYETRVDQQLRDLENMNRPTSQTDSSDGGDTGSFDDDDGREPTTTHVLVAREDLDREEAEIRELEQKKKSLEERVADMEKDLGGLMR